VHILYAINNSNKQLIMSKNHFFLIICLVLQFSLCTPSYSANKSSLKHFNSTLKQAKGGNPKAMFLVARMLEHGKGIKKNINEASKWYQRSASQNYAAANARLGKLYLEGIGVKKNTRKAFNLLNLAAIQGIPVAQFNLAIIYELGVGTKRDLQEAIKWYDLASNGGYFSAKSKSNTLKKQLGINTNVIVLTDTPTTSIINTNIDEPIPQDINQIEKKEIAENETEEIITDDINEPELNEDVDITVQDEPIIDTQLTESENEEEQALLSNSLDTNEIKTKNTGIQNTQKQKLDRIKNLNIKRSLQTLLDGSWFDKNRPVNFLPSPKAQCNLINISDLKCVSRELQRHTDKETVFYKTLGKISKLTSDGNFLIQYQNTVIRVIADKVVNEDGVLYQSKIKTGLQKKIHQLNCQYKDFRNLICIKDNANKYHFKNRSTIKNTSTTEE